MPQSTESSPKVFISYRREDTGRTAAALASSLRHALALDVDDVFLDRDGIHGGDRFPDRLREALGRATVVLVLIGKDWLKVADNFGVRRLDKEDDWVRVEIAQALESGKVVAPILFDGALHPPLDAFRTAKSIEELAHKQSLEFLSGAWDESVDKICALLERHGFRRAPRRLRPQPTGAIRSTLPQRGNAPFHGRDDLLADLARRLDSGAPLIVLHGPSGVGKSELAREFARRNEARFPGGRFVVDMRASGAPVDLARLGWILGIDYPPGMPLDAQCYQALLSLAPECLLIYDNAQRPEHVEAWLPPAGVDANVIVTTVEENWDPRWHTVFVPPLRDTDSLRIVVDLAGSLLPAAVASRLVRQSAGIPMQLVPATLSARKAIVLGGSLGTLEGIESPRSFEHPWALVDADARLLLFACTFFHPERASAAILEAVLADAMHWRRRRTEAAISIAKDQGLLEGKQPLRMHQLLSSFIRERAGDLDGEAVALITRKLADLLRQTSAAVTNNPASADHTLALLSFALDVEVWNADALGAAHAHAVGLALSQIGRFAEAVPWL